MITYSSTYRSTQTEIMDEFDLKGDEMKRLLSDLSRVNRWLGGTAVTLNGIEKLLASHDKTSVITVLDIGCGDGEMLRNCSRWARQQGIPLQLIGLDANPHIVEEAKKRSEGFENCTYEVVDVFSTEAVIPEFDIALCTLFLHHFKEEQIVALLQRITIQAKVGVVINDLHRSRWAFWLFRIFGLVFLNTRIARHDGLVSIARGFKRDDLARITKPLRGTHELKWKWAFRYQWVIKF